jgi:hypothetical protein
MKSGNTWREGLRGDVRVRLALPLIFAEITVVLISANLVNAFDDWV